MALKMSFKKLEKKQVCSFLLDLLILIALVWLSNNSRKVWGKPAQRGFFCDDETLMYPYRESTVGHTMLYVLSFYLPLMVLIIMESYNCWRCWSITGSLHFWSLYSTLRYFIVGYAAQGILKSLGKYTIGRLRPHFFDVCQPQLSDGGSCTDAQHKAGGFYHTNYTCQPELSGATPKMLREIHISFPSGHSSMAFYGLVFLALYLQFSQRRCSKWCTGTLLRPLCQLGCLTLAWYIGLSRVLDYKHHWSDVAVGSLLGAVIAFVAVRMSEAEAAAAATTAAVLEPQKQQLSSASLQPHGNESKLEEQGVVNTAVVQEQQLPHDLCLVTCHSSTLLV